MSKRFKLPHNKFNELRITEQTGHIEIVSDDWDISITTNSDVICLYHKRHGMIYKEYFEWCSQEKVFKLVNK